MLLTFLGLSGRISDPTTQLCFSVASLIAVISYQAHEKLTTPFSSVRAPAPGVHQLHTRKHVVIVVCSAQIRPVSRNGIQTHATQKGISKEGKKSMTETKKCYRIEKRKLRNEKEKQRRKENKQE